MTTTSFGKWKLLGILFPVALVADQVSKFLAVDRLTFAFARVGARSLEQKLGAFWSLRHLERFATEPFVVWAPVWRMNYVENPAAAFGMFGFVPPEWRFRLFVVVSLLAVVFVVYYYRRLSDGERFLQVSLAFVLAGTIGNLIDRLARHYVIDFVEWYWWNRPDLRWPTFNIADSLLVVGIGMILIHPSSKRPSGLAPPSSTRSLRA